MTAEQVHPTAILVDVLGELHRAGGEEIRLKELVALGEAMGVPGPTVRVTLARLRERGWFQVRRDGRESLYRLTDASMHQLREGGARLFRPAPEPWSGDWSMVVYTVPESDRPARDELRRQLAWQGFSPLAPATWISPHPRLEQIAEAVATLPSARVTLLTMRTAGLAEDRALAERCWELSDLALEYEGFLGEVRLAAAAYRGRDLDRREAFVARVRLVHSYRRVSRRDPHLPVELQRPGWPGDEAYRLFGRLHARLEQGETPSASGPASTQATSISSLTPAFQ